MKQDLKEELKAFAKKEDLQNLKNEMDTGFAKLKNEMDAGFAKLKNEMDAGFASVHSELASIRKELDEIHNDLKKLERRTLEDADVTAKEMLELHQRVDRLEQELRQLQRAPRLA